MVALIGHRISTGSLESAEKFQFMHILLASLHQHSPHTDPTSILAIAFTHMIPVMVMNKQDILVKLPRECITEKIVRGCGREANIARGAAECQRRYDNLTPTRDVAKPLINIVPRVMSRLLHTKTELYTTIDTVPCIVSMIQPTSCSDAMAVRARVEFLVTALTSTCCRFQL